MRNYKSYRIIYVFLCRGFVSRPDSSLAIVGGLRLQSAIATSRDLRRTTLEKLLKACVFFFVAQ